MTVTQAAPAKATSRQAPPSSRCRIAAQLQPDQDEGQHVQHEDRHLPHGVGGDAVARVGAQRREARDGDRIGHHGDDGGDAEPFGDHPGGEDAEELEQDGQRQLLHPAGEPEYGRASA